MDVPAGKVFSGFRTRWEIVYRRPPGVALRQMKRWAKEAGITAIRYWHGEILPKHFVFGAGSRWHYARRSPYTYTLKIKKFGMNRPLVMRGFLEAMVMAGIRVSGTSGGAKGVMVGPYYAGIRKRLRRGGLSPDIKGEVRATDEKDVRELAQVFERVVGEKLKR